jgi:hypothetical protein
VAQDDVSSDVVDVQVDRWQMTWTIQRSTFGKLWLVVEVPPGPVMGCHVAPCGWLMALYKIYMARPGSNPRPPLGLWTGRAGLTARPTGSACYVYKE